MHGFGCLTIYQILTLFVLSAVITECFADRRWNVDQNRLEIDSSRSGKPWPHTSVNNINPRFHNNRYASRDRHLTHERNTQSRIYHSHGHNQDSDIAYSQSNPIIISKPWEGNNKKHGEDSEPNSRTIYRSLQDPATFYKDRVFINVTENEKRQRLNLRPQSSFNSLNYNDQNIKTLPGEEGGVAIHLNGATIRVRPEPSSKQTQWIKENYQTYDNSLSDMPSREISLSTCIRCPAERTVVASRGRDKAPLLEPQLQGCKGKAPPPGASFRTLYGPRVGDLLTEGSHITLGSMTIANETQGLCQYRYNVVVRRCPAINAPPSVVVTCPKGELWGAVCHFSCAHKGHRLKGRKMAMCKDDMQWSAPIPRCEEPEGSWCNMHSLSRQGKITCDTPTTTEAIPYTAVPHGSVCSVFCHSDAKTAAPKILTCREGLWHGGPACKKSRRRRHKGMKKNIHYSHLQH